MAIDLTTVGVVLQARGTGQVKSAFASVKRELQGLVSPANLVKGALAGMTAGLVAGSFLRKLTRETIDAQNETAQLAAVLKSTGGAAGMTMKHLDAMAASFQGLSVHSDGAIKGAQGLLLTFTQIRGPEFKGAVQAVLDMSTAMGTDLKAASIQVGKALNDPIKGVTALAKAGVQFSEDQKAMIKSLVETGQTAKAQQMILKELEVQFGGSALAARNTLGGALTHLGNKWDELFTVSTESSLGITKAINDIADALPNARAKIDTAFSGFIAWVREVEERLARVQAVAFSINRFFGGNAQGVGVGSRGGGGGGGRGSRPGDPAAPIMMPGVTVMAPGKAPPRNTGGGAGGTGKANGVAIPKFEMPDFALPTTIFDESPFDLKGAHQYGMTPEQLDELFAGKKEENKKIVTELDKLNMEMGESIRSGLANTLGDAIYNGFAAAFNGEGLGGIFKAFGKTILAGIGDIMVQQGQALLTYGITMQAAALGLTNPFTAGPAAIAAGAALIALGAAFGAISKGGGGRGTAQAGAFREPGNDIVRLKFVDRPGLVSSHSSMQPLHFSVIGVNDAQAQRAIGEIIRKGGRR